MDRVVTSRRSKGRCAIAVMAKASEPGKVKTRLSPPLAVAEAAALNTAFLTDMADKLAQAGRRESVAAYFAFGPTGSEPFFRSTFSDEIGLLEVWRPNFGDCLYLATAALLEAGHDSACVLNSDSPTLPSAYLVEAARLLGEPGDRAVLGPSSDGGYYLLGLKQAHRRMFEDIAWSTEVVAEQTIARAAELGLDVHMLPTWYDVDDANTLRRLVVELDGASAPNAPATASLLRQLDRDSGLLARLESETGACAGLRLALRS